MKSKKVVVGMIAAILVVVCMGALFLRPKMTTTIRK